MKKEDMEKSQFISKIKDILVKWCETREKNYCDINFDIKYCTGKTFIRFTTTAIDSILPPTSDTKGSWGNGHYIFYEIENRESQSKLSCYMSQKDIYPEGKKTCSSLINSLGKKITKENWEYKSLKTWKLYKYKEDESIKDIEYKIIESLNNFMDNEMKDFENYLLTLICDNNEIFEVKDIDSIDIEKLGNDKNGIKILNEIYHNIDIKKKERLVKVIERGQIANEIKMHVGYKCQVCESLGINPYSFKKTNGDYYVETHHIIPVADTENSKLSVENLICVCPNHHRQIHYGNVKIIYNNDEYVEYKIDDDVVKIQKVTI